MRKIKRLLFLVLLSFIFAGCHHHKHEKFDVVYSVYPIGFSVQKIAGDIIKVGSIYHENDHIHHHEPGAKELVETNAKLIFAVSPQLETFLNKPSSYKNSKIVFLNKSVELIYINKALKIEDPHIWNNVENMKKMAEVICENLVSAFPEHKDAFLKNKTLFINELDTLLNEVTSFFNDINDPIKNPKGQTTVLVDHDAFNYFEKHGFKKLPLFDNPENEELTEKEILEKISEIKLKNIKYIARVEEEGLSKMGKKIVSLLKKEGIELKEIKLYAIETRTAEDIKNNHDYFYFVRENLKVLKNL